MGGQFLSPWSHEEGRLTNACYNPDRENGGCPSLGHHGFRDRVLAQPGLTAGVKDEEESAGGGGRGQCAGRCAVGNQSHTDTHPDIADVCVIVLQPRVEESAQAWEAGNTAVIALPLTGV